MISFIPKNILTGIGILFFGFNFVGLALISSGSNNSGNPAWEFIKGFWYFERITFFVVAVIGFISLIILLVTLKPTLHEPESSSTETKTIPKVSIEQAVRKDKGRSVGLKATPIRQSRTVDPPLSTEELKRKALKQITGKEF